MKINLNECVLGQKLKTSHGKIVTYNGKLYNSNWPHSVRYPNGSEGTRTDDGFVYANPSIRMACDENIVEILPMKQPKTNYRKNHSENDMIMITLKNNGVWEGDTKFGKFILCTDMVGRLFPVVKDANDMILSISTKPSLEAIRVVVSHPMLYWILKFPTIKDSLRCSANYFCMDQDVILKTLCRMKRKSANTLPKKINLWIKAFRIVN